MAQTQSRTSKRSTSRPASSSSNGSGSKPRASRAKQAPARKSSSNRSTANRSRARKAPSSRSNGPVDDVKQAVTSGAQSTKDTLTSAGKTAAGAGKTAAGAVGGAAQKAKGPAMAGGAALAGLAGGLVLATRGGRRRVLGVPMPGTRRPLVKVKVPRRTRVPGKGLLKAAGEVGSAGRQVGELASEVRLVREQMDSRRRRSPVEVVLEGLTSRRSRA
jgi:hypothetical protein